MRCKAQKVVSIKRMDEVLARFLQVVKHDDVGQIPGASSRTTHFRTQKETRVAPRRLHHPAMTQGPAAY